MCNDKILIIPNFNMHINTENNVFNMLEYYDLSLNNELIEEQHKLMIDGIINTIFNTQVNSSFIIIAPPNAEVIKKLIITYDINLIVFFNSEKDRFTTIKSDIESLEKIFKNGDYKRMQINADELPQNNILNSANSLKTYIYTQLIKKIIAKFKKSNTDYNLYFKVNTNYIRQTINECNILNTFEYSKDDNTTFLNVVLKGNDALPLEKTDSKYSTENIIPKNEIIIHVQSKVYGKIVSYYHNVDLDEFTFDFGDIIHFAHDCKFTSTKYVKDEIVIVGKNCFITITFLNKTNFNVIYI